MSKVKGTVVCQGFSYAPGLLSPKCETIGTKFSTHVFKYEEIPLPTWRSLSLTHPDLIPREMENSLTLHGLT